jgi:hypothetical protein
MMGSFRKDLEQLINGYSMESNSHTPDFLLAQYLERCLDAFDEATRARDRWYGVHLEPGNKYFKKD